MKNVNELTVTVKYSVSLNHLNIPEQVYSELVDACENGNEIEIDLDYKKYPHAIEWLNDKVNERDAQQWSFEIDEIS